MHPKPTAAPKIIIFIIHFTKTTYWASASLVQLVPISCEKITIYRNKYFTVTVAPHWHESWEGGMLFLRSIFIHLKPIASFIWNILCNRSRILWRLYRGCWQDGKLSYSQISDKNCQAFIFICLAKSYNDKLFIGMFQSPVQTAQRLHSLLPCWGQADLVWYWNGYNWGWCYEWLFHVTSICHDLLAKVHTVG